MKQIVEELIKLNQKDWLDILAILLPILLTVVVIIQNIIFHRRSSDLERRIHNRDQIKQYHDDILMLYNTYYEFCDTIITSGFSYNVRSGNVNLTVAQVNNLNMLKLSIGRKGDLAKLIFGKNEPQLYNLIDERFKLATKIIDQYLEYINNGKLFAVSENAWNLITGKNPLAEISLRYNYIALQNNPQLYDDFMKLCKSEELDNIEKLIEEYGEKHTYENYDRYFEKYFQFKEI